MRAPANDNPNYMIPDYFENPVIRPYLRNVRDWQGYIRFLGLPDRRDNPDIIIDRLFVAPVLTRRHVSPDENPESWFKDAESLVHTLAKNTPLVLLGDPGIGKSTLLNYVTWLLSRPATNPLIDRLGWRLPLPMVLRELPIRGVKDFDGLLEAFLSREMSAPLRDDEGRRYLSRTLAEGNAFLLLDGIDEIGDRRSREDLREAVFDGIARFPDCRWLLSSRIVGYDEVPFDSQRTWPDGEPPRSAWDSMVREGVTQPYRRERHPSMRRLRNDRVATRYVAPFDDSRIAAFARNWYYRRDAASQRARANADHLIRAVHADDSILRLARVPNLLTMMALIHRIEATLPHGRALLYDRIAEAYLESIDKFRGIDSSPHDLPRKKIWLARVGFEMQRRRTSGDHTDGSEILVDYETVLGWLNEEMGRGNALLNPPSAREFLDIVGRRSGLFLPRGEGRYAFVHLSFQEYFAAVALAREVTRFRWARREASRLGFDRDTVASWAGESVWRETFAFLFELLASEDEDDWHADLLDCVFGEDFSRLDGSESEDVVLNLGRLLARLIVNHRSGLPPPKRDNAIAHCARAQLQLPCDINSTSPSVLANLVGDDARFNAKVFKEVGVQLEMQPPENQVLDLRGARISDIEPFADLLPVLWELVLTDTLVSDIKPLGDLSALECLFLEDTLVSDIRPLASLSSLEWLELGGTLVSDISPLANLSSLQWLGLWGTEVSDIAPLTNLFLLQWLALGATQVSDIGPLANLSSLEWLALWGTEASDIGPLANLSALEHLYLSGTPVQDIEPLANLSALEHLDLRDTLVSDIDPIAYLPALKWVNLTRTPISSSAIEELRACRSDLQIILED